MNATFSLPAKLTALAFGALLITPLAQAVEQLHSKHVIKIATDGAEVIEADVSDLELGESESFVTESGRTVDILRVPEGIELYLDGELVETGNPAEDLEHRLALHEELMTIECEDDTDACDEMLAKIAAHGDGEMNVFVARHEVEEICDEDGNCDRSVWIEKDSDVDIETLHGDGDHEVIVIRKEIKKDSD